LRTRVALSTALLNSEGRRMAAAHSTLTGWACPDPAHRGGLWLSTMLCVRTGRGPGAQGLGTDQHPYIRPPPINLITALGGGDYYSTNAFFNRSVINIQCYTSFGCTTYGFNNSIPSLLGGHHGSTRCGHHLRLGLSSAPSRRWAWSSGDGQGYRCVHARGSAWGPWQKDSTDSFPHCWVKSLLARSPLYSSKIELHGPPNRILEISPKNASLQ